MPKIPDASPDPEPKAPTEYANQKEYIEKVGPLADTRQSLVETALRQAFARFIETREVEVIVFDKMSAADLATALMEQPILLKPLLAACNLAGRALKRDLKLNVDTYEPILKANDAHALAGYLLSFLPNYLEIPTLARIDRISFIDKEVRADKGRWEKLILDALNTFGKTKFKKRHFKLKGEDFELDAATPPTGDIEIAVDVKRIEARQDIHKRSDEIVNKAAKFKAAHPAGKFAAVVYYPFVQEHANVQNRLQSESIDCVVFASGAADSIENAVRLLLAKCGVKRA